MVSYEKCLQWQELFNLAVLANVGEEKLVEMGYRVAGWPFSSLNFELKYNFSTRGSGFQEAPFRCWQSIIGLLQRYP